MRASILLVCIVLSAHVASIVNATASTTGNVPSVRINPPEGDAAFTMMSGPMSWQFSNLHNGTFTLDHDVPVFAISNDYISAVMDHLRKQSEALLGFVEEASTEKVEKSLSGETASVAEHAKDPVEHHAFGSSFTSYKKFKISGEIESNGHGHFMATNEYQWRMIRHDHFEGQLTGWNNDTVSTCGTSDDKFLGGPCHFAGGEVAKTYNALPPHTQIRVTARFHFFDQWNGESGLMRIEDKYVWSEKQNWCDKILTVFCFKYGVDVCGNEYPDRLSSKIDLVFKHSGTSLKVAFGSTLTRSPCEASWGVDDVIIYIQ